MSDKHLYEYVVDPESRSAGAFVVELVGADRRVLEIGCGPGSITRILAAKRGCRVTGIELDAQAIEKAAPFCEAIVGADLNNPSWPDLVVGQAPFDVVVAADVLEHLQDPWASLERMAGLIGTQGYLVVSLPHACHAAVLACLIAGDFEYRDWGLLDKTHIRFFGLPNMQHLFERAGMKIIDFRLVIKAPEETEFAARWQQLSPNLRHSLASQPHASIYQVVIKAVPKDRADPALILQATPNRSMVFRPRLRNRIKNAIARRLGPYPRIKQGLRRLLRLFRFDQ